MRGKERERERKELKMKRRMNRIHKERNLEWQRFLKMQLVMF
jgi:hypothetical protein